MVPGAEDWQAATAAQSLSNASPSGRVTQGNQSLLTLRGTKNKSRKLAALYFLVPGAGIEPARPYRTTDFKSVASAYSAIRAYHCFLFFSCISYAFIFLFKILLYMQFDLPSAIWEKEKTCFIRVFTSSLHLGMCVFLSFYFFVLFSTWNFCLPCWAQCCSLPWLNRIGMGPIIELYTS